VNVSLLIPTIKPEIKMLHSNNWRLYSTQFLSTKTKGLSKARNELATKADGKILVFADDDATMTKEGWELATSIKPHEICMTEGKNHPISRVMSVHAETFWDMGGFDESIKYNGEDLDFYLRALRDYKVIEIPKDQVIHKDHAIRQPYLCQFEAAYIRVKHGITTPRFFVQKNPIKAMLRILGYFYWTFISPPTPYKTHVRAQETLNLSIGDMKANSTDPIINNDLGGLLEIEN